MKLPLLLGIGLLALQPQGTRYVPETGWERNDWAAQFYENWYGGQLRAMREPSISSVGKLQGFQTRFRLLVVPNYDPARAYRIDLTRGGSARLRWVQLDGAGGYLPGRIAKHGSRVLTRPELEAFRTALKSAALHLLRREPESEAEPTTICLHATHYVFEQLDEQGHHFVTRENCEVEESLQRLRAFLSEFAPQPKGRR